MWTESEADFSEKMNDLFSVEIKNMTRTHLTYVLFAGARFNIESQNIQDANLKKNLYSVLTNFALN